MDRLTKKYKILLALFLIAAYIVIPFADSIACDDCMSLSAGKDADVKHLCPLCFNDTADYLNSSIFNQPW